MKNLSERLKFKINYRKVLEISFILALLVVIILFQSFKRYNLKVTNLLITPDTIIVEKVDLTRQIDKPPAPDRPKVPVPSEDDSVPEDATMSETELAFNDDIPIPPAPPIEDEPPPFILWAEQMPEPIGGYAAIQKHLEYPPLAIKAGIEGTVIVQAAIDKNGSIKEIRIIKSLGNNGCDEAAVLAVKSVKWKPAFQRDKPVGVWVSIPIHFRLRDAK